VTELLTAAAATFVLSAAATWAVRRLSYQHGWLALPRADRAHTTPTALFGGIAIFVSLSAGLLIFSGLPWPYPGLLALTTGVFFLGLADDIWDLRPQTKLVAQIAAGFLLYLSGFHFNDALPRLVDLAIVVFWVVGITNAMNLLDNMNGLCAGTAAIAVAFRLMFFVNDGNVAGATASAVFLGAIVGFLVFNFPRASIFMGDAGSLVVGFVLAALNLTNGEAYSKGLFSVLFFPVLALALPIFDTAFVSVVRALSGRPLSHGGQDHTSHRLVAVGLSETAAVLVLHGISIASGMTAFVFYQVGFSYAWFIGVLLVLTLILFGVFLANVKVYPEDQVPGDVSAGGRGHFSLVSNFTYKRTVLWVIVDTLTILVAWYAAFLVRYGQTPVWSAEVGRFTETVPIVVLGMLAGLYVRGLYRTDWQHLSFHELKAIVSGTLLGLTAALIGLAVTGNDVSQRVGLFTIALGANMLLLSGTRIFVRTLADMPRGRPHDFERVLVYGAGKGGELTIRELRSNAALSKMAVGFLDDDPGRKGMTLHGVPVLGGLDSLGAILAQQQVDAVLVSTRKLPRAREEQLTGLARSHGLTLYRLHIAVVPFEDDPVATSLSHASGALRTAAQTGAAGGRHDRLPNSVS
jgi:UDP-GlcNAc:undecaprenyl-phosphate GlcNAc-1-phosphate transferase